MKFSSKILKNDFNLHSHTTKTKLRRRRSLHSSVTIELNHKKQTTLRAEPIRAWKLKNKPCLDFLNPPFTLNPSSGLPLLRISIDRDPDRRISSTNRRLRRTNFQLERERGNWTGGEGRWENPNPSRDPKKRVLEKGGAERGKERGRWLAMIKSEKKREWH